MNNMIDLTENEMMLLAGGDRTACFISGVGIGLGVAITLTTGGLGALGGVVMAAAAWDNARVNGCFR
ncbi:MAG: hypothetical protein AB7U82_26155 [Blastocatellales bacterium]